MRLQKQVEINKKLNEINKRLFHFIKTLTLKVVSPLFIT